MSKVSQIKTKDWRIDSIMMLSAELKSHKDYQRLCEMDQRLRKIVAELDASNASKRIRYKRDYKVYLSKSPCNMPIINMDGNQLKEFFGENEEKKKKALASLKVAKLEMELGCILRECSNLVIYLGYALKNPEFNIHKFGAYGHVVSSSSHCGTSGHHRNKDND